MDWFRISYHRGTGAADGRGGHADVRDEFRFHLRHVVRQHGQPHGFELRERQFSRQRRFRQLRHGLSVGYVHACGNQSGGTDVVLIKKRLTSRFCEAVPRFHGPVLIRVPPCRKYKAS